MKYIRTKDGVFETNKLPMERFSIELVKIIDKQVGLPNPHIGEIEIIKQADTIEELCDEKVGTFADGSKPHIYKKMSWVDLEKDWTQYHNNLYGAIWCEWGLKYVAKMNEKGVLELL